MATSSIQSAVHPTADLARAHVSGILSSYSKNQQVKVVSIDVQETEAGFIAVASIEITDLEIEDEKKDQDQGKGDSEAQGKGTGEVAAKEDEEVPDTSPPLSLEEKPSPIPEVVDSEKLQQELIKPYDPSNSLIHDTFLHSPYEAEPPSSDSTLSEEEQEQMNELSEKLKSEFAEVQEEAPEPAVHHDLPGEEGHVFYTEEDRRRHDVEELEAEEIRRLNDQIHNLHTEDLTPAA